MRWSSRRLRRPLLDKDFERRNPGLVGVAGLTQDSNVMLTSAVLSLLLGVIGVLGELKLRRRRDGLPAWREAAAWRTRPGAASGIFISYRHNDAGPYARLLQVYLLERFPYAPVFMDLDSIEAGADFAEAIEAGALPAILVWNMMNQ
jgi:hypothetical protein